MTQVERKLRALLHAVLDECARNREFAERIEHALGQGASEERSLPAKSSSHPLHSKRSGRRPPGQFDPFEVYTEGEARLRRRLAELDEDQLKDIIAEHSMDTARAAMKWKDKERLVSHIVTMVAQRSRKGEVFMSPEFKVKISGATYVKDWTAVLVGVEFINRGPADTITSIQLCVENELFTNSVPFANREVPELLEPAPLRLEQNDGRQGALYFGPSLLDDRPVTRMAEAELIVHRASGNIQRTSVTIRRGD